MVSVIYTRPPFEYRENGFHIEALPCSLFSEWNEEQLRVYRRRLRNLYYKRKKMLAFEYFRR